MGIDDLIPDETAWIGDLPDHLADKESFREHAAERINEQTDVDVSPGDLEVVESDDGWTATMKPRARREFVRADGKWKNDEGGGE